MHGDLSENGHVVFGHKVYIESPSRLKRTGPSHGGDPPTSVSQTDTVIAVRPELDPVSTCV